MLSLSKEDPRSLEICYKKFLNSLDDRRIENLLERVENFDTFMKKVNDHFKARSDFEKLTITDNFSKALEYELETRFVSQVSKLKSLIYYSLLLKQDL